MKRTISSGSGSVGRRSLLGAAALAAAAGVQSTRTAAGATNSPPMNRHLLVDDRISDLLQHPAFAGFARLLLPGGSVTADPEVPLRDIGSLMPYHSRVHPPEVVAALNAAFIKVLADPEVRGRLSAQGLEPPADTTPAQLSAYMRSESDKWRDVVKASGAKAD